MTITCESTCVNFSIQRRMKGKNQETVAKCAADTRGAVLIAVLSDPKGFEEEIKPEAIVGAVCVAPTLKTSK